VKVLSVVVPVYYNEQSLPLLLERMLEVERQLAELDMGLQLIFVDDGSGDASWQKLLEIKEKRPDTKLVKLSRNFGAVHASKTGFRYVTGDCFMIVAADLQDPPELIVTMARHWQQGSKFVICERAGRDDPWLSKLFSKIYYRAVQLLVIRDYPEGGFDMALMDRSLLPHLVNSSKNVFTPLLAYWLGYKPTVITYRRPKRQFGKSRWTFSRKFKSFLDVMLGFSVTPIRLMSGFGVIVAALSFLYGGSVVINALVRGIAVPGFASIVALVTFLLGIIIMMLGVIGEYLWRIFDETNKRPETVIDEER
jgi:dolichol-phosphate mannosyltransferase